MGVQLPTKTKAQDSRARQIVIISLSMKLVANLEFTHLLANNCAIVALVKRKKCLTKKIHHTPLDSVPINLSICKL